MYCVKPIKLYRELANPENLTMNPHNSAFPANPIPAKDTWACGKCWVCRERQKREWAIRIEHESKLHAHSEFITLTYAPASLPANGSLRKKDFQDFMKRLRKNTGSEIRYYHSGEYGSVYDQAGNKIAGELGRPHYHAILFGYEFPDKTKWRKSTKGFQVYRSQILERAWPLGHSEIGSVTEKSCTYTANYVSKKVNGNKSDDHYGKRIKEYSTASRNPPIGYDYYQANRERIETDGKILYREEWIQTPRIYTRLSEAERT